MGLQIIDDTITYYFNNYSWNDTVHIPRRIKTVKTGVFDVDDVEIVYVYNNGVIFEPNVFGENHYTKVGLFDKRIIHNDSNCIILIGYLTDGCFLQNGFDFETYDKAFLSSTHKKFDYVYERITTCDVSNECKDMYIAYLQKVSSKMLLSFVKKGELEKIKLLLQHGAPSFSAITKSVEFANENENVEIITLLLNYKNEHFTERDQELYDEKEFIKMMNYNPYSISEMKKSWNWEIKNGYIKILSYKGKDLDVILPSKIGEYEVRKIDEYAFSPTQSRCKNKSVRQSITSISLPDTITHILSNSFSGLEHLDNIHLPSKLEYIGRMAFSRCASLTKIDFPLSLESIEAHAFSQCSNLNRITFRNPNTRIYYKAFAECEVKEVHGILNSTAHQWAKSRHIKFLQEIYFEGESIDD